MTEQKSPDQTEQTDVAVRRVPEQVRAVPAGVKLLVAALAVALVASLVGLGLTWRSLQDRTDQVEQAQAAEDDLEAAQNAAEVAAVAMGSYDYRSLDKDFGWFEQAITDDFRKTFATEGKAPDAYLADLKKFLGAAKGHADAEIVKSAAQAAGDGEVTVLLFVDQVLSNGDEEPSQALTRVEMTMVEEGDRWLVDDMVVHNPDTVRS